MNRGSEDEAWRAIVENYGERARLDDDPRPETPTESSDAEPSDPDDVDLARIAELTGAGAPVSEPPEPLDEPFVPPTPPPLPRPAPARLAAWLGVLGVPVALLVLLLLQAPPAPWLTTAMVLWFLGGFAYLVASMPGERPDDGDNGARV